MRGILLAVLFFSLCAHADVFDDYSSATQNAMNQIVDQANSDANAQQKALKAENKAALALTNQQQQETEDLNNTESNIASLQKSQAALQARVNDPLPAKPEKFLFWHIKSAQQKENAADQAQLSQVTQQLSIQSAQVATMKTDITQRSAEITIETQKLAQVQKAASQAMTKAANLPADQQLQIQQAAIQANSFFNQQRMNGFQAQFLLSDLNQLQTNGKLTAVEAQALKSASEGQLNNTLMGQYVNTQIRKAVASTCSPDFQSACTSKEAGGVTSYINQQLSAPSSSGAQVSTDAAKAPAAVTFPAGANPAGSNAGTTN